MSIAQAVEALQRGANDFLTKPLNLDHFAISVSRSVEARRLRREVQRFPLVIGHHVVLECLTAADGAAAPTRTVAKVTAFDLAIVPR